MADKPQNSTEAALMDAAAEERILFFPEPCTRLAGDGCTRCATVCPAHAISFVEGENGAPCINGDACSCCGICIGVCDCFASSKITTIDHAKRMLRRGKADGLIYLCCREDLFDGLDPADNVIVLNCLSSLSPEFLTYLLSSGTSVTLCHDMAYCDGCTTGGTFGGKLWQRAVEIAQEWAAKNITSADTIPEKMHLTEKLAAPDRRELFTAPLGAVGDVASGEYRARKSSVVEDFLARQEAMRAKASASTNVRRYLDEDSRAAAKRSRFARRILLEEATRNDPTISERIPTQGM